MKKTIDTIKKKIKDDIDNRVGELNGLTKDLISELNDSISGLLTAFDKMTRDIVILEVKKRNMEAKVAELDDRKRFIEEKEQTIEQTRRDLSERGGLLEDEIKLVAKKKARLDTLEHDLLKKQQIIDERIKNYRVAKPVVN